MAININHITLYLHFISFEVITVSVRSMRFHRIGLMVAVYQSLHTREQIFKSSVDRNLNMWTRAEDRFRGSLSCSSESNFGTGRITYLGMWLHFFELDNISSMGTSTLLAIGSLVRISSSIFMLPETVAADSRETLDSGMYSDYKYDTSTTFNNIETFQKSKMTTISFTYYAYGWHFFPFNNNSRICYSICRLERPFSCLHLNQQWRFVFDIALVERFEHVHFSWLKAGSTNSFNSFRTFSNSHK